MTQEKPIVHRLKSWPESFAPVLSGEKRFELRRNDRDFHVGDLLLLQEWEPSPTERETTGGYTGREVTKRIIYVMTGAGNVGTIPPIKGLSLGYAILGLEDYAEAAEREYQPGMNPADDAEFGMRP